MPLLKNKTDIDKLLDGAASVGLPLEPRVLQEGRDLGAALGEGIAYSVAGSAAAGWFAMFGPECALMAVCPLDHGVPDMALADWIKAPRPDTWVTRSAARRAAAESHDVTPGQYVFAILKPSKEVQLARVETVRDDGTAGLVQLHKDTGELTDAHAIAAPWMYVTHHEGAHRLFNRGQCMFPTYFNFKVRVGQAQKHATKAGARRAAPIAPKAAAPATDPVKPPQVVNGVVYERPPEGFTYTQDEAKAAWDAPVKERTQRQVHILMIEMQKT